MLLTQLAAESGGSTTGGGSGTAQKLHQLLVPSYFPGPEEGVVSATRVCLIDRSSALIVCCLLLRLSMCMKLAPGTHTPQHTSTHCLLDALLPLPHTHQARVAALLKEHPPAGQAFCRLLVAPFLHYIEGGKGE